MAADLTINRPSELNRHRVRACPDVCGAGSRRTECVLLTLRSGKRIVQPPCASDDGRETWVGQWPGRPLVLRGGGSGVVATCSYWRETAVGAEHPPRQRGSSVGGPRARGRGLRAVAQTDPAPCYATGPPDRADEALICRPTMWRGPTNSRGSGRSATSHRLDTAFPWLMRCCEDLRMASDSARQRM